MDLNYYLSICVKNRLIILKFVKYEFSNNMALVYMAIQCNECAMCYTILPSLYECVMCQAYLYTCTCSSIFPSLCMHII